MARNKPDWSKDPGGGPPELGALWQRFNHRISLFFGRSPGTQPKRSGGAGLFLIAVLIVWLASGFYYVPNGQRGVVIRLGSYVETVGPGPHWGFPLPFEYVHKVDITNVRSIEIGIHGGLMPTADGGLFDADFTVNYLVKDPVSWLFNVKDPAKVVQLAAQTAVRQSVAGETTSALLGGHDSVSVNSKAIIQTMLNQYQLGVMVTQVIENHVGPPDKIASAYADINSASDKAASEVKAARQASDTDMAEAKISALHVVAQAKAYKIQKISTAQADADRFNKMLGVYEKNPGLTREKMYLDTMQTIIASADKVVVGTAHDPSGICFIGHGSKKTGVPPKTPVTGAGKNLISDQTQQKKDSGLIEDNVSALQKELRSRNRPERP
ncbi:MAG TPA: FtsH protease activity modulator HflK [Burkholderiales bacterium]|nr:FtsH protease activity modulator HflK [Burkholderiales bacterium]